MDPLKMYFLLILGMFHYYVSFREGVDNSSWLYSWFLFFFEIVFQGAHGPIPSFLSSLRTGFWVAVVGIVAVVSATNWFPEVTLNIPNFNKNNQSWIRHVWHLLFPFFLGVLSSNPSSRVDHQRAAHHSGAALCPTCGNTSDWGRQLVVWWVVVSDTPPWNQQQKFLKIGHVFKGNLIFQPLIFRNYVSFRAFQ